MKLYDKHLSRFWQHVRTFNMGIQRHAFDCKLCGERISTHAGQYVTKQRMREHLGLFHVVNMRQQRLFK